MFIVLLAVTFVVALISAALVAWTFSKPIGSILDRIVSSELAAAWRRYLTFAILVVGVSGGVRIWELEKYVTPRAADAPAIVLNPERWTLEIYRTAIGSVQSVAWMLLLFFCVALLAYVILRGLELRQGARSPRE